jgi:hypothetical protein
MGCLILLLFQEVQNGAPHTAKLEERSRTAPTQSLSQTNSLLNRAKISEDMARATPLSG